MSVEREYIKELLSEIEVKEELVRDKQKDNGNLREKVVELTQNNDKLKKEADVLRNEMNRLKTKVHTPCTITNPTTLNIFEAIKEGSVITFMKPQHNSRYKEFSENPFIFELDGKGAVFCGKLLGMYEMKKGNIYYYHESIPEKYLIKEITHGILNISDKTLDCKVLRKGGYKRGKQVFDMKERDILKLNPIINIEKNKFVSNKHNKFYYTKNDGSKYIILENGEEEAYDG